jgi:mono/diheme cytochrome c family protein
MSIIVMIVVFGSSIQSTKKSSFGIAHTSLYPEIPIEFLPTCINGIENPILVPEELYPQDFEEELYTFILNRTYAKDLKWCADKRVRDTGPWIQNSYYGVHPAVRIYYSPRMMYWLTGNPDYWQEGKKSGMAKRKEPREGPVPPGAMIVKEMFTAPATIYQQIKEIAAQSDDCDPADVSKLINELITSWTVMIKTSDDSGPADGWYWGNPGAPARGESIQQAIKKQLDDYSHALYSGFGLGCIRCHASAEDGAFTFSALRNIEGFEEGANLLDFVTDNSWRNKGYLSKHLPIDLMSETCLNDSLVQALMMLPAPLRPWENADMPMWASFLNQHRPMVDPSQSFVTNDRYPTVNPEFAATFPNVNIKNPLKVRAFPTQWADHVVPRAAKAQPYITSDNCLGCHGGLGGDPSGVDMFVQTGPEYGDGYNISEYGEWRWSPMGLAGRDPIFYSQLESEMVLLQQDSKTRGLLKGSLKDNMEQVSNTCLSCHGAMGQRQLTLDAREDKTLDSIFRVEYVYLSQKLTKNAPAPPYQEYHEYGELAREGISCTVCHHINAPSEAQVNNWKPQAKSWITASTPKELAYFLFHNNTGRYERGPTDELFGPFKDVATLPMQNALEMTPVYNEFTSNSQMCGTCHTINLPNIGMDTARYPVLNAAEQNPALKNYNHSIEQATFLEWQNSAFAKGATLQSCQDCHMPNNFKTLDGSVDIDQVSTRIATIQTTGMPEVEYEAPENEIHVPLRENYKRHELVGLNVFLLEMFDQFPDVLGVAEKDIMTYATTGNSLAIENMVRQAREETVDVGLEIVSLKGNTLTARVTVTNKTGHRYPSGVGFRRGFLELLVMNGDQVIWGSGRTNSVGVIVDKNGQPLETEFLPNRNTYQRHHQKITSQDQVQIYEELVQDKDYNFTTSFIHRVHDIKDNRLLPKGWRAASYFENQGQVMYQFMLATNPHATGDDPDYMDQGSQFKGQDQILYEIELPKGFDPAQLSVKATMYNQSIPPFWLHQRFTLAPDQPATQRLFYLTSRLNLEGTPMENWKLRLDSDMKKVK